MKNITIVLIIIIILIILIITGIIIYLFLLKDTIIKDGNKDGNNVIICNTPKEYTINELRDFYEFTDDDLILF